MNSEDDQDDLEDRKGELWSMDEVRSGGASATTDAEETGVKEDTSVTSGSDDEAESSAISTTEDIADGASASTETDTSDQSDTSDQLDTETASVEAEEEPALQAQGETVRQMARDAENKGLAVRDLHNVNVYLFEGVYHDMQTKFKKLDTEYYAVHGEDLSKNKDFFNAVFRAGLQSPQLAEELEIE